MIFRFTRYIEAINNQNRIILINKRIGSWIKISTECYTIIDNAICAGCDEEEFFDLFEDNNDKEYMRSLVNQMKKRKIIVPSDDKEPIVVEDISIDFTNSCNLHCKHCLASATANTTRGELSTQEYKDVIQKLVSLNPESITISGGEPLTRPDFFELCEYIRSGYNGELYLMTNGTLISEKNVERLSKIFTSISISLDGADEQSSQILRDANAFTKALRAINLLQSIGFNNISASMVETRPNQQYIPDFIKLCNKIGVYPMVRAFAAIGRGKDLQDEFSVRNDYCMDENLAEIYEKSDGGKKYSSHQISGVCSSAFGSFYMDANGNIFPCTTLCSEEFKYGNIKDIEDFQDFIFNRKYEETCGFKHFSSFFPENDIECSSCAARYFCWHCVTMHIQQKIQDKNMKVWCQLQTKDISTIWNEAK